MRKNKDQSYLNEIEKIEKQRKISKAKSWFLKRFKKIDKPIARLMKKQRRRLKFLEPETKEETIL